ncbi:MAG: carbon-nitrogen hydrolase family protein [Candidatus Hydrogenedentes bacterium]|nr:carbon-nitrogen hydrolase family protein [Candidatus Hydrogenedentota bacterium]
MKTRWLPVLAAFLLCALPVAGESVGRPVRVASFSFPLGTPLEQVWERMDAEAASGVDLFVLPEMLGGGKAEPLDGPIITAAAARAKKHRAYVVAPIYRLDGEKVYNSAVLLDREGNIGGIYDKAFPVLFEFRDEPRITPGSVDPPVFETDFGKLGCAICFDANFPELWKRLGEKGAELVVFPSAYSAGTTLQEHALINHFYIVSATWNGDCIVCDITGRKILDERGDGIHVSRITLDLDRCVFHLDYNRENRDRLLKDHGDAVAADDSVSREGWFVLEAKKPGVSVRVLAAEYGVEPLREYIERSRREINRRRGEPFPW